jgi:hypothetical protein
LFLASSSASAGEHGGGFFSNRIDAGALHALLWFNDPQVIDNLGMTVYAWAMYMFIRT